ncbi:MAG: hypothetical protein QOE15_496 [Acidimicrobiaceae bacterium]|nr:hypothetical protein [Acidimicrobiaceae bacterium]
MVMSRAVPKVVLKNRSRRSRKCAQAKRSSVWGSEKRHPKREKCDEPDNIGITETNLVRRAELIEQAWSEDGASPTRRSSARATPGINEFVDTVCEHYSSPRFRPVSGIDEVTVAGVDVGHTAPDGRLHDITGFFGDLPSM